MGSGAESPEGSPLFEVLGASQPGPLHAPSLVAHAARHGLSALVADRLAQAGTQLTAADGAQLQADARAQISRGLKLKRLSLRVLDALAVEGVVPVMLKGYGLALRLFPEQPLARPSTDVDVLVTPPELERARLAMARLGLTEHRDTSLADVFEEHHHLSFVGPAGLVEVHFRLFSGFGGHIFNDALVRSRLQSFVCEGRSVLKLSPEDEFLYLATHAANHSFLRISWLVDLQRFVAAEPGLDWARMGSDARDAGFASAVGAALWLLESSLRVTLPTAATRAFRVRWWRKAAHARLFSRARVESAEWSSHRVYGFALRLWLVDSPRDGLHHVVHGARRFTRKWFAKD